MSGLLTTEERERLEALFDRAADLPSEQHEAFVERECPGAGALRDALATLLKGLVGQDALHELQHGVPSRVGERIGPYLLRERVGLGGMGEVYAADQLEPVERRVAIKFIRTGMDSAQVIARFEAERQALARMAHAHVAQVFDAGATAEGRPFFVMELVTGEAITDHCDAHCLSTRQRLELFIGACEGVQHAHHKGILHRDLKPSNILVLEQSGRAVPKIIDFGVARATTGRLGDESMLTMAGQVVGTLAYMSPEQADASYDATDTRSDVYSLGVVLYQLLTGLMPMERLTTASGGLGEVYRAIREDSPSTPSRRFRREASTQAHRAPLHGTDQRSLIRQLAGDLDWIVLKTLEKDPSRRYQSASELAADIRRHLEHLPVLARKPGVLYRTGKFVRRHRVTVVSGAAVAFATVTAVVGVLAAQIEARASKRLWSAAASVSHLEEVASDLWPADPEMVRPLEKWLAQAGETLSLLKPLRARHEELRGAALISSPAEPGVLAFPTPEAEEEYEELSRLFAKVERLSTTLLDPEAISQEHGWSIPMRLDVARNMEAGFAEGGIYHEAWLDALPKIRGHRADLDGDGIEELVYPDLSMGVQMGLVPLAADPDSHLWEFAHLASAEWAPDADGRLVRADGTGIVLVLIPQGAFEMGSQFTDPELGNYVRSDAAAWEKFEEPVHPANVRAFFLSKCEMAQAQWERFQGSNPSGFDPDHPPGPKLAAMLPVHRVSWDACHLATSRLGLSLPTEQEWEYAARGGLERARWTGLDVMDLIGCENVCDQSRVQVTVTNGGMGTIAPFDDGYKGLAPVDSLKANPFGLHHMLGNVSEWTSSRQSMYRRNDQAGPQASGDDMLTRGGNFISGPELARAAFRGQGGPPSFVHFCLGLRPARAIVSE